MSDHEYSGEEIQRIRSVIRQYHATDFVKPSFYLLSTLFCILVILFMIHKTKKKQYLVGFVIVLAFFLMRLFMMFHDLCHKSFFPTNERETGVQGFNFFVAQIIEGFNQFTAFHWNKIHSAHHSAHGNMNTYDSTRTVLTSSEYEKMPQWKQVLYDVFRNPLIFFLVAPFYIFWLCKWINQEWSMLIKYAIFLGILYRVGSFKLLFVFLIAQYIAGILALMLFHLQHQVNVGYWKRFPETDTLSKDNAELRGASVLKIPWILDFFTNGIEYHNVHHLDPGVPSYRIRECYEDLVRRGMIPDNRVGYVQSFQSLFHVIYNEKNQRYESDSVFQNRSASDNAKGSVVKI
jgi:omega-6 fatty acid desaturase (delta-12 desaturase)